MPPATGVSSDVEESILDITGPSSFPNDFSLDSNLRSSSRNIGPTAPSSVPIQTPPPSGFSPARYVARRNNDPGGGKSLDSTPLQRKSAKRSNAMMTLREHEKVLSIF